MKLTIIYSILIIMGCFAACADEPPAAQPAADTQQQVQNPLGGTGPVTPEELAARREEITGKAAQLLDSFVGTFRADCMIDGIASIADLVINAKTLNDNYYMGSYSVKPASGGSGYEAFTIFTFNGGAMSYLFFYFGNDSYIRNYLGSFAENEVMVRSPHPTGMEFIRWSMVDADTLKHETWKPSSKTTATPEGEPDQVILFKRTK